MSERLRYALENYWLKRLVFRCYVAGAEVTI